MSERVRRGRRRAALALGIPLALLALPFLSPGRVFPGEDFRDYFGPHARLARESFQSTGRIPDWNPRQYAGIPLQGSAQNCFSYPPNLVFLVLDERHAWELLVFLHLALAALGSYRLARAQRLPREAAALAGIAFGLSFPVVLRASQGHLPNFVAACLAPWLVYRLDRILHRPDPVHILGASLPAWGLLVGGSPQFVIHAALLAIAWLVYRRPSLRTLPVLAAVPLLALAVAAPYLREAWIAAGESTRSDPRVLEVIRSHHDFTWEDLGAFLVPRFHWNPGRETWLSTEKVAFTGTLTLLLGVSAAVRCRRGPTAFWVLVLLAALIESFRGVFSWIIPPLASMRIPERVVWVAGLALAQLAARGWAGERTRTPLLVASGAGMAALLLVYRAPISALLFAAAAGAGILLLRLPWSGAGVVAADLLVALAMDLRPASPGDLRPEPWYLGELGPDPGRHRLLDLTTWKASPVGHGVRLLRGYGHPVPGGLQALWSSAWESTTPEVESLHDPGRMKDSSVLHDLDVRWVVLGEGESMPSPWTRLVAREGKALWEDPTAPGAVRLGSGTGKVEASRPAPDRLDLRVDAEGPDEVLVSEQAWPGWQAELDGRPVEIGRHRGALMKVGVPAGRSTIVLVYSVKAGWTEGLRMLGLGAALGFAYLARSRRAR